MVLVFTACGSREALAGTGTEFETVWRSLHGKLDDQADYLSLLDATSLPALFKQSLTAPLLSSIITAALHTLVRPFPPLTLAQAWSSAIH